MDGQLALAVAHWMPTTSRGTFRPLRDSLRPIAGRPVGRGAVRRPAAHAIDKVETRPRVAWRASSRAQREKIGEPELMKTLYVMRALPVRDADGTVAGWVRADPLRDGTKPTDMVFLRDGSACGQLDAMVRIARSPGLLYASDAEAVRDGLARLREADARAGVSKTDPGRP